MSIHLRLSRSVPQSALVLVLAAVFGGHAQLQTSGGTITEASIRGHMEFLASDAMNGRGSGTDDEWRAAVYMGSQMRRWGIEPLGDNGGYVQKIESGRQITTAPPTLTIAGARLVHGGDILVQSTGRGTVSGPLAQLKVGARPAAGAFVIVPAGVTPDAAAMADAVAILTVETPQIRAGWDAAGARPAPGGGRGRGGAAPQARIVLSEQAFARLSALPGGTEAAFEVRTRPGYTWNAIGQLKGSDAAMAADVILLTAHLDHLGVRDLGPDVADHIYNGADDDASGSTAVLELAEAIARGPRPKRTVMFAWFGSEESGGAGARHFLAQPPAPLERIVANLEFEMIANRDDKVPPHTLWLTGYERSNLGPELARQGARIVADPHPEERFFQRSDNIQLACRGVIAQTVSSYDAKGATYHKPADDVAHVDFAHMTESIQSMLAPVLWLSNAAFKPDWLPGQNPGPGNGCGGRGGTTP
jgi:hypothetical protein